MNTISQVRARLRVALVTVLLTLASTLSIRAQDDAWTCDGGPHDIVDAIMIAFDAGDMDTAEALALEAQTVCADNARRLSDANNMLVAIERERTIGSNPAAAFAPDYPDVRYGPAGESPYQVLDVYLPPGGERMSPVVMLLHGCQGNKRLCGWEARHLNEWGYAAVALEYREDGDTRSGQFRFSHTLADTYCALAWLHADGPAHGLDPERVVLAGTSLGGWVAAQVGAIDDPARYAGNCPYPTLDVAHIQQMVKGVITAGAPWTGCVDAYLIDDRIITRLATLYAVDTTVIVATLETLDTTPSSAWYTRTEWPVFAQTMAAMFPLYWIDGSEPPFLILHGQIDEVVPVVNAETLAAALEAYGVTVTLAVDAQRGHSGTGSYPEPVAAFLGEVFAPTDD